MENRKIQKSRPDPQFPVNKGLTEIASGTLWIFIGLISGYILEYANKIIIARFYGPSNYGVISLALTFSIIVISFSLLGLHTGAARYIAIYASEGQKSKITAVVIEGLKIIIPMSLLFSIFFFLAKEFIISHFIKKLSAASVIIPFILLIPIAVVAEYFHSCLRGLKLAKYAIFSREIIRRLITLITLIFTIIIGKKLVFVAFAYLLGFVGYMFSAAFWIRESTFSTSKDYSNEFKIKELITFSLPLVFSLILMQIGAQMSNIFLGYFKDSKEVGFFSAALPFSQFISLPLTIILFMFLPVMSEYWNKKEYIELKMVFKTICRWLFFISGFIFLFFVLYSEPIIVHTFGEKFQPAYKALIILSIGQFFNTMCGPTGALLLAAGESKKYFIGNLISMFVTLMLYLVLIPRFGFLGAAYATMSQIITSNLVWLYFACKTIKVHPFSLKILLSIIVLISLLIIVAKTNFLETIYIGLQIVILSVVYLAVMLTLHIFCRDDIIFFYDLLKIKTK